MEYMPFKDITKSCLYFSLLHTISYYFSYIIYSDFYLLTSTLIWQYPQPNPHRHPLVSGFVNLSVSLISSFVSYFRLNLNVISYGSFLCVSDKLALNENM